VTTQLNFSAAANPVSALVGAGLTDAKAAPAGGDSGAGGRFAELFTGQMLKLERQGLAMAQDGLGSLQMMPLGQTINVITSDAPVPDIHSLLAFAKAQGLDDLAVAGLFGDLAAVPQGVSSSLVAKLPGVNPEAIASAVQPATLGMLQAMPGVTIVGLQVTPALTVGNVSPAASANTSLRAQEADPAALASTLALAVQAGVVAVQVAEDPLAADAEANPALLDALRVQMGIPGEAITRRLAQMSGSKTALGWAELVDKAATKADARTLAGVAMPMATTSSADAGPEAALALASLPVTSGAKAAANASDLSLRLAAGPQPQALGDDAASLNLAEEMVTVDVPGGLDLDALLDRAGAPLAEAGGPRQGAAPAAANNPHSAADAARAAFQERAEQTQLLADRMGQALANRLINQIERGQWKLQMRMQPAALGRVEISLDMHAGGLDAVFRTDNALTQDLLGQGAQRLREALTQSGTTVASVTVHADARGQSGGNSTPQKRQSSPKQSAAPAAVGAAPDKAARYTGGVAEGLNVLA